MKQLLVRLILLLIVVSFMAPQCAAEADGSAKDCLVEGRFGMAFDAAKAEAEASERFKQFPMSVELWCKLNSSDEFNIVVSCEPKESADHWEIYTEAGAGTLSAYLPGMTPAVTKTAARITDGKWHYVAMVADGKRLSLFVDGKQVGESATRKNKGGKVVAGVLRVGKTVWSDGYFMCDGAIDELRLSNIARRFAVCRRLRSR